MGTIQKINRICSIDGCEEKYYSNGFCEPHYKKSDFFKSVQEKFRKTDKYKAGQSKWRRFISGRLKLIQIAADKRGLPFNLIESELLTIIEDGNCFYCNSQIGGGMGVDRMDLDKSVGYIASNLIRCCKECNVLKNNLLSHEEMIELVKLLKNMRKTEYIWENIKWRKNST